MSKLTFYDISLNYRTYRMLRDTIAALESLNGRVRRKKLKQNRALMSDASITQHRVFLNDAAVVLLKRHKAVKISLSKFHLHIKELS